MIVALPCLLWTWNLSSLWNIFKVLSNCCSTWDSHVTCTLTKLLPCLTMTWLPSCPKTTRHLFSSFLLALHHMEWLVVSFNPTVYVLFWVDSIWGGGFHPHYLSQHSSDWVETFTGYVKPYENDKSGKFEEMKIHENTLILRMTF